MPLSKIQLPTLGTNLSNLIVNGNFEVDQRGSLGTPVTSASTNYPRSVDGNWMCVEQTDGQISVGKVADAPSGTGLKSSFKVTVTSADTSLAAAQRMAPTHSIEASTWQHLEWHTANAKSIAVQFQVKCSVAGTYGFTFRTSGSGMSYTHPYTISSANTWEKKTFTIPGPTSLLGGSVGSGNNLFYYIIFGLGLGTDFDTGANDAWTAVGNGQGRSSHTNLMATNNATWQLTGFQIEEGNSHSEFQHETFNENLMRCQRYYQNSFEHGNAPGTSTDSDDSQLTTSWTDGNAPFPPFPTTMRAKPTITFRARNQTATGSVNNGGSSRTASASGISNKGVSYISVTSGTGGQYNAFTYECSAEI